MSSHLKSHLLPLPLDLDGPDLEVDPDGGDVVPREGVVCEADEEGALAHARVADDEQLEEVVVVLVRRAQRHLGELEDRVGWISVSSLCWKI